VLDQSVISIAAMGSKYLQLNNVMTELRMIIWAV